VSGIFRIRAILGPVPLQPWSHKATASLRVKRKFPFFDGHFLFSLLLFLDPIVHKEVLSVLDSKMVGLSWGWFLLTRLFFDRIFVCLVQRNLCVVLMMIGSNCLSSSLRSYLRSSRTEEPMCCLDDDRFHLFLVFASIVSSFVSYRGTYVLS